MNNKTLEATLPVPITAQGLADALDYFVVEGLLFQEGDKFSMVGKVESNREKAIGKIMRTAKELIESDNPEDIEAIIVKTTNMSMEYFDRAPVSELWFGMYNIKAALKKYQSIKDSRKIIKQAQKIQEMS